MKRDLLLGVVLLGAGGVASALLLNTRKEPTSFRNISYFDKAINGESYSTAEIDLKKIRKLWLPEKATVIRDESLKESGQIFIQKIQEYRGHPEATISIFETDRKMGIDKAVLGHEAHLSTFGEWGSIEGGRVMNLIFRLPVSIETGHVKYLGGKDSVSNKIRNREQDDLPAIAKQLIRPQSWVRISEIADPDAGFNQVQAP